MKVLVLGGGPGGYVTAIRLAQLGAEVTLVEKENLGGTCLNAGCIPTKALLNTAKVYQSIEEEARILGIEVDHAAINWPAVQARKQTVVQKLVNGVQSLLCSNGVNVIKGRGRFADAHTIAVSDGDQAVKLSFDAAIIAAGAQAKSPPIPGADLTNVITSTEALSLPLVPDDLCIIGGGAVGCELAGVYASFGTKVTILEALPDILMTLEKESAEVLKRRFKKNGIGVHSAVKVENISQEGHRLAVTTDKGTFCADYVLMATGRAPDLSGLGLEELGIQTNREGIVADTQTMQTSIPHIYAVGDCIGGIQLAHVASAEGETAAEHLMGHKPGIRLDIVPSCVYTTPELASVGLTENQAREKGYSVKTGIFPMAGNGKALISAETDGMVKIVADAATEEVLGLHIAGPRATDMIAEGALALRLECTIEEIITTIHAHPTVSEAVQESALSALERAIHMPKAK